MFKGFGVLGFGVLGLRFERVMRVKGYLYICIYMCCIRAIYWL